MYIIATTAIVGLNFDNYFQGTNDMILDNFYVDDFSKNKTLSFGMKELVLSSIEIFTEIIGRKYVHNHMFFVDFASKYSDYAECNFNFTGFNSKYIFRIPNSSNFNFYVSINNIAECELAFNIIDKSTNKKETIVISKIDTTLNGDMKISGIL